MNYKRRLTPPVRRIPGTMNQSEAKYAHLLEDMKRAGEIVDYKFEPLKFRIGPNTTYCPDFMVVHEDHICFVEIKGFMREDAVVKFKVCAEMYSIFRWKMVRWNKGWKTVMEG